MSAMKPAGIDQKKNERIKKMSLIQTNTQQITFPSKGDLKYKFNNCPRIEYYRDSYYLLSEGLFCMGKGSSSWTPIDNVGYFAGKGVSLTSTPEGLVLYGGKKTGDYFSDMWILSDAWRPIAGNQPRIAYHAACWIPDLNALLIHGGENNGEILSDCFLIDLVNGSVKKIQLDQQIPLSHHTITLINYPQVMVFGGIDRENHLNKNLYSIDLRTFSVKLLSSNEDKAMRCSHHAFNFFGYLCVAGGFKYGAELRNFALFDSTHNEWLMFFCNDYLLNASLVLFEQNGFKLFTKTARYTVNVYFNQNYEPIADINDPQLVDFFSRLLDVNTYMGSFKNRANTKNNVLQNNLEKARENMLNVLKSSSAELVSKLTSEKDQLEQANLRFDLEWQKQASRIEKLKQKRNTAQPNQQTPSVKPLEAISLIAAKKKKIKDMIANYRSKIDANMARIESMKGVASSAANLLSFDKSSAAVILKATASDKIDQELKEADEELYKLNKKLDQAKYRKRNIDESFVEGLDHLQKENTSLFNIHTQLYNLKRDYFDIKKKQIIEEYKENGTEMANNADCQKFQALFTQFSKLSRQKRLYEETVPQMMSDIYEHLKNVLRAPSPTSEIDTTIDLITEMTKFHNASVEVIQDPAAVINSSLAKPQSKARAGSGKSFSLDNDQWGSFYNNIIDVVDKIGDVEKKSIQ